MAEEHQKQLMKQTAISLVGVTTLPIARFAFDYLSTRVVTTYYCVYTYVK